MTEHADIALVRQGYVAFSSGDVATLSGLFAEDVSQSVPGNSRLAGEKKGRQAVLEFYGQLASETNGTFRVQLDRLFTDGQGTVVATHRSTGERAGRKVDVWEALTFTVVDGTVRQIKNCADDIEKFDDFWA
jgi:uncharacterized protein